MRSNLWRRLEDLFAVVLDAPPGERRALVEAQCGDDFELKTEALSYLDAIEASQGFLEELDTELAGRLISDGSELAIGSRVGPFRILEELGHGGMGTVYLAERVEGDFEQQVALKVIRWSGLSYQLRERFYVERQILARLQHPGIARLLDGGITEEGDPWFAMEVVEGRPITDFCSERGLNQQQRISLFLEVCDAVRYAHRLLVVHRDLKPSNILINSDGRPKLVDFGIAKALSDPEGDGTNEDRLYGFAATPEYTAPEVLSEGTITTGSDVFSLAVVLHELLVGVRPIVLADTESPDAPAEDEASSARSTPHEPLAREPASVPLKPDLEAIIQKGIDPDPERRYRTIEDFESDIGRFMDSRPITARPNTPAYRFGKFVRRNRGAVLAALLVILSLMGGLIVSITQTREARQQAVRAEEIKDFLIRAFDAAGPATARGETLTARQILDEGARRIRTELVDQPEVQIELQMVLGSIYRELGLFAQSDTLLSDAVSAGRVTFDGEDQRMGSLIGELASLRLEQSRLQEADSLFRIALDLRKRLAPSASPEIAAGLTGLANTRTQLGEFEEAEALHREALKIDEIAFGGDDLTVAEDLQNLGWVVWRLAKYSEADSVLNRALTIQRHHKKADDHKVALTLATLGKVKSSLGDEAAAEKLHRDALALRRRILGDRHPDVALSLSDLALVVQRQGRLDEASDLFEEALDLESSSLGWEHAYTINTLNNLAICNYQMGQIALGVERMKRVVDLRTKTVGGDHADALTAENNLGAMLHAMGADREALQWLERVNKTRISQGRENEIDNGFTQKNLGDVYSALSMDAETEKAYVAALNILRPKLPANSFRIGDAEAALGELLVKSKQYGRAIPLLRDAVRVRTENEGPDNPKTVETQEWLSKALGATRALDEAERLRLEDDFVAAPTPKSTTH
ncbi:MAG: serine/threonine-protein kinase [Rhodothermales bacterium]